MGDPDGDLLQFLLAGARGGEFRAPLLGERDCSYFFLGELTPFLYFSAARRGDTDRDLFLFLTGDKEDLLVPRRFSGGGDANGVLSRRFATGGENDGDFLRRTTGGGDFD